MKTARRVVVTGIGTINPIGNNIEEYFKNLENGVSGATEITPRLGLSDVVVDITSSGATLKSNKLKNPRS